MMNLFYSGDNFQVTALLVVLLHVKLGTGSTGKNAKYVLSY